MTGSPAEQGSGDQMLRFEAALSCDGRVCEHGIEWRVGELRGRRAEGQGVAHAGPGLDRLRGSETVGAKRWRCIRNAHERVDAAGDRAAHVALPSLDDSIHRLAPCDLEAEAAGTRGRSAATTGRTKSSIAALNLAASSTNGSWPDCSNQTSFFDGAVSASK